MPTENIPPGVPRVIGFVIAPHVVFDDGTVLRQGPPVEPVHVAPDGLAVFADQWGKIFDEFSASVSAAQQEPTP